jgi:hypothetical protein
MSVPVVNRTGYGADAGLKRRVTKNPSRSSVLPRSETTSGTFRNDAVGLARRRLAFGFWAAQFFSELPG